MIRPGEAIMFVLELVAYVGVAWWGYHLAEGSITGILLALAAIAVMGVVWGLFAAPNAPFPVYGTPRIALEVVWFGIAVLAYVFSGLWVVGVLLALAFAAFLTYRLKAVQA